MIDERQAHIICVCGERVQSVRDKEVKPGELRTEWDEEETGRAYREHLKVCTGRRRGRR
ncbi:MAG: hypothetical protein DDT20_01745 [Firmicutes bacterium]|nr:hypothetical protein [Bacillota bacterium]